MPDWQAIAAVLAETGVDTGSIDGARPVSGGDINAAWRVEADGLELFVKTAPAASLDMFTAEADGLNELASAKAIRIPAVHGVGVAGTDAFIALEWLSFESGSTAVQRRFGEQLAAMHRHTAVRFGWHRDNTIGLTPQRNPWSDDWIDFFREHRLDFQLRLAADKGYSGELQSLGRKLSSSLAFLFRGYSPEPSLLHGDLWGGNWAVSDGEPVIFDPAVYYGDRESDLAMTRLFGGFGGAFYESYESAWPLAAGSGARLELYQLYHVLNHLNLFGGGYAGRAVAILRSLCRQL